MTLQISDDVKNGLIKQFIERVDKVKNDPRAEQIIFEQTSPDNDQLLGIIYFILAQDTDIEKKQEDTKFSVFGGWFASIFKELRRSNRLFFSEFCLEVERKIVETRKRSFKEYIVVFPLNFKSSDNYSFTLDGFTFDVMPFEEFESNFSFLKMHPKFDGGLKSIYDPKFSYFAATIKAKDRWYAEKYARRRLQAAIGLLIFSDNVVRNGRGIGVKRDVTVFGRLQRLSNLVWGSSLTFEDGNLVNFVPDVQKDQRIFERFDEEILNNFFTNVKRINDIQSEEIVHILFDALKPYYEAFLWSGPTYSFFKYWHCIEFCMLKDELTEKDMTTRLKEFVKLKRLFSSRDKDLPTKIDIFYLKRNDFVHESKEEFTQFDRNDAKAISELLIDFLLMHGSKFSGRVALKTFLNYILKSDSALLKKRTGASKDKKEIIDFILELRKDPVIS
jgi:hypothetical protein